MQKQPGTKRHESDRMRPEYEFGKGVRGKHILSHSVAKQLDAIRAAAKHAYPTADMDAMLKEIESGYGTYDLKNSPQRSRTVRTKSSGRTKRKLFRG